MDSIWNCAFGVDMDMQYNSHNDYFEKCEAVFKATANLGIISLLGSKF